MVVRHYVVVDGERYFVPDSAGVQAVRDELLQAVRGGGAYVSLGRSGFGYTDVLVTALTPVRIEHVSSDDAADRADAAYDPEDVDPSWWL